MQSKSSSAGTAVLSSLAMEYMYCVKARCPTVLLPDVCLCSIPSCLRNFVALLFPILVSHSEGIKIWYELPGNLKRTIETKWLSLQLKWFLQLLSLLFILCMHYCAFIYFVVRLKNGPVVHLWKCRAEIWPAS